MSTNITPFPSAEPPGAGAGRNAGDAQRVAADDVVDGLVDEVLMETFPASDPPAWWAGTSDTHR